MSNDRSEHVRRLRDLLVQTRHAMEQAEARVADCNDTIRHIGESRVVPHQAFLGRAVSQPYDVESGRDDTGLVIQAALLVPQGFGVCRYDTEEYYELNQSPDGLERDALVRFCPFSECDTAEKAFLNSEIDPLFQRFIEFVDNWRMPS